MSQDAGGERLSVSIVADATGFEAELRRKVTTAAERVKARIKVEVDQRGLQQGLRQEVRRLEAAARIKARVEIDPTGMRASLQKAVNEATRNVRAKVMVDAEVNRDQLQRDLANATGGTGGDAHKVKVPVDADTGPVDEAIDKARSKAAREPINVSVNAKGLSEVGSTVMTLTKIPAIAAGVFTLVGAVGNLVVGLTALTSTAVQAAGAVAAIPAAGAAAIQVLGTAVTGFSGVGDALKGMSEAKAEAESTAGTGAAVAAQQEAASARIEAATRSLSDARRSAADVSIRSSESIRTAEQRVAAAQQDTTRAQQELNAARRDAAERLRDLRLELSGAALDEEGAQLAVQRAAKTLKDTERDAYTSDLDRDEADLAFRQAQQRLKEVTESNADLRRSGAAARKAGVKGDAEVIDASNKVRESKVAEVEAQRDLNFAVQQAARDQAKAATDVARAVTDLGKAQAAAAASTGAASAAQIKSANAMKNLTPEGRRFVKFIHNQIKPALSDLRKTAQAGLLPGVQAGVATLADKFLPKLDHALDVTADALGGVAEKGAQTLADGPFAAHFGSIVDSNTRVITLAGDGLFHIGNAMASLIEGSGPFLEKVAGAFGRGALNLERFLETENQNGGIAAFFDRVYTAGRRWYRVLRNLVQSLGDMSKAARPAGNTLLTDLVKATDRLAEWTSSPEGQKAMEGFFKNAVKPTRQIGNLLLRLSEALIKITDATGGGALDGFFFVLDGIATALTKLAEIPGVGKVMTAIAVLSGAGFGLGLVATAIGGIVTNLGKLGKLTGAAALLNRLRGGKAADGGLPGAKGKTPGGLPGAVAAGKGTRVYWTQCLPVRVCGKGPGGKGTGGPGTTVLAGGDDAEKAKPKGRLARAGGALRRGGGGLLRRLGPLGAILGMGAASAAKTGGASRIGGGARAAGGKAANLLGGLGGGKVAGAAGKFGASRAGSIMAKVGGKSVNLLKGGGIVGIAASIAGSMVGDAIAGDSKVGSKRRALGSTISGAATGAGIGATVGSIVPVLGTGVGAAVGGGIGLFKGLDENGSVWRSIKAGAGNTFDYLAKGWSETTSKLGAIVSGVKDVVVGHFTRMGHLAATAFRTMNAVIISIVFGIRDRVAGAFQAVAVKVRETFGRVRDAVREKLGAARQLVHDVTARIIGRFRDFKDAVIGAVAAAVGYVARRLRAGMEAARAAVVEKLDMIRDKFVTVKDTIVKAWQELLDMIAKPLKPAIKLGKALLDKVTPDAAEGVLKSAFGMAEGGQVNPRPGGTLVRLAEDRRPESVVDSGLLNRRLAEMDQLRAVLAQRDGPSTIVVNAPVSNAVPEPASVSLPRVLRETVHLAGIRTE